MCYPCFMIIDHETKENQSINQSQYINACRYIIRQTIGKPLLENAQNL